MSRQNRVTPFGEIIATPARGLFMGNRGCLHDAGGNLTARRWSRPAWVTCRLAFKGRQRELMAPGRYTELFFLDEATALAAGHRPCANCQRERYETFKALWTQANASAQTGAEPAIQAIDRAVHAERIDPVGQKRLFVAPLDTLPDGSFIAEGRDAFLVLGDSLWRWSASGYRDPVPRKQGADVSVLTPNSVMKTLLCGYRPMLHGSIKDPTQ